MNQPAVPNQRAWALFTDLALRLVFDLGHDISSLFGPFKLHGAGLITLWLCSMQNVENICVSCCIWFCIKKRKKEFDFLLLYEKVRNLFLRISEHSHSHLQLKNQISLHVFQNADFSLDTFISTLAPYSQTQVNAVFQNSEKHILERKVCGKSPCSCGRQKEAEFGNLYRFRTVLKGSICFRLDALNTLQWLEWSTGSRTGTAGA